MISPLDIGLRLIIWLLLTADVSLPNLAIGIAIALLLPHFSVRAGSLKDWLRLLWQVTLAIPQAYIEAVEMMVRPHSAETIETEPVQVRRTPGLIFLDIFRITFTPKTIVLRHHQRDRYEVHRINQRRVP